MVVNNYNGFSEEHLRRIALKKIYFRMSVKIHLAIFIIINLLLLVINLIFTPTIIWVTYPLFGWLIGLAEHGTAYIIYARGIYPSSKRGIIFHIVAFILVMLYLLIINISSSPSYYWVLFPTIFWSAALGMHLIIYLIFYHSSKYEKDVLKSRTQRAVEKELEKMKKKMAK